MFGMIAAKHLEAKISRHAFSDGNFCTITILKTLVLSAVGNMFESIPIRMHFRFFVTDRVSSLSEPYCKCVNAVEP
jgi:hypothetical protein